MSDVTPDHKYDINNPFGEWTMSQELIKSPREYRCAQSSLQLQLQYPRHGLHSSQSLASTLIGGHDLHCFSITALFSSPGSLDSCSLLSALLQSSRKRVASLLRVLTALHGTTLLRHTCHTCRPCVVLCVPPYLRR